MIAAVVSPDILPVYRLLVLGISQHHPLVRGDAEIESIDFGSGRKDRSQNKVSGKGKKACLRVARSSFTIVWQ